MELAILIMTIVGLLKKGALATRIGYALSEQCVWYCAGSFLCTVPAVVRPTYYCTGAGPCQVGN